MEKRKLLELLNKVKSGKISMDKAMHELRKMPFDDIGFAKIDTHRSLRKGFPEVIFCQGKSVKQITGIVKRTGKSVRPLVLTRADRKVYNAVKKYLRGAVFNEDAGIISVSGPGAKPKHGRYILVVSAGTADIPVAEEAAAIAGLMGNRVTRMFDVGVAGLHRLLDRMDVILKANVVIVVAGMEGALPSVIAGLVSSPVIAVPTSVGYGASFGGISALLTMLNSCAPGIGVVNIDNGFGAGYLASLINR